VFIPAAKFVAPVVFTGMLETVVARAVQSKAINPVFMNSTQVGWMAYTNAEFSTDVLCFLKLTRRAACNYSKSKVMCR
jgi:hypothetical protein